MPFNDTTPSTMCGYPIDQLISHRRLRAKRVRGHQEAGAGVSRVDRFFHVLDYISGIPRGKLISTGKFVIDGHVLLYIFQLRTESRH